MALPPRQGLNVLSLDGGGIKGYTTLLILQRIFRQIKHEHGDHVEPCDVFDLIVGTSTGGLIAVMLGRLHMTIEECLQAYREVGQKVFGKKSSWRWAKAAAGSTLYDIKELQSSVATLLSQRGLQPDEPFHEEGELKCRV